MRGRGGGEGGLGTISSELLLWVSMAKREEGGGLETRPLSSAPCPPCLQSSQPDPLRAGFKAWTEVVSANLVLPSQTGEGGLTVPY